MNKESTDKVIKLISNDISDILSQFDFHAEIDKKIIISKVQDIVYPFSRDASYAEDLKKQIRNNWENLEEKEKIDVIENIGDLDNYFVNLVYQKFLADESIKNKFPQLFNESVPKAPKEQEPIVDSEEAPIVDIEETEEDQEIDEEEKEFEKTQKKSPFKTVEREKNEFNATVKENEEVKDDSKNIIGSSVSINDLAPYGEKKFDRHPVDDYSCWTDRSIPTPELDNDPRMAEDSLDPEKPRGMSNKKLRKKEKEDIEWVKEI